MSRGLVYSFVLPAAAILLAVPAYPQAVISTHSGLVHYFEGAVFVAGQRLEARFGRFANIPDGAELRTEQGRAEVLLTPGVILRVGENSAIRMLTSALSDSRLEVLSGSAIVESSEPAAGTSVTLLYKGWSFRQDHQGLYRIDCDPPRLKVRDGEVQVSAAGAASTAIKQGMELPLAAESTPTSASLEPPDTFTDWSEGRAQSISADNAIAADIQDPGTLSSFPTDGFTYFPLLGFPTYSSGLAGAYGSNSYQAGLYSPLSQPGFYSLYPPGYTYRPYLLRLPSSLSTRYPSTSLPPGYLPRNLYSPVRPSAPTTRVPALPSTQIPAHTAPPASHPVTPAPSAPHPVVHAGGHK